MNDSASVARKGEPVYGDVRGVLNYCKKIHMSVRSGAFIRRLRRASHQVDLLRERERGIISLWPFQKESPLMRSTHLEAIPKCDMDVG